MKTHHRGLLADKAIRDSTPIKIQTLAIGTL